jgi:SNF2 family DNA or RNA helicase
MKSSLLHYQLLGTAFMREREGSQTRPYGGLVSDDMGLGKTVMAIANIVDGRADPKSKVKATLVVAPSSLVNQWMNEISTHADISKFGRVLQYRSGSRGISADPVADFSDSFVVITSYSEVVRSWPKKDPPPELCTGRAISEWWEQQRSTKIGVLHKVTWRRVVIDEAHLIKNHLSRTSEAVCQLKGKFRWALSGTPVQNKIEEFFAFFHFLQIPHTGTYELFRKNFCKKDSHLSLGRLQQVLSRFMLRRTHADELLGAPILKLPKLQSRTVTIEFNIIEKAIYRIVKERFVENIRAYVRTDSVEKKYQSIFVLLLRLRQLTAHCLLVQDTLTDLLNEADLQRLWTLTEEEINPENGRLIQGLTVALSTAPFGTPEGQQQFAANRPILSRFRKYLQDLKDGGDWRKIIDRTVCTYCHEPPTNPHITSCHHIYCLECLNAIGLDAAHNSDDRGSRCVECGVYFGGRVEACAREELTPDRGSPASVGSSTKKGAATKGEAMGTDWFTVTGPSKSLSAPWCPC